MDRRQANRSSSRSCSDKLCRWAVAGLQGLNRCVFENSAKMIVLEQFRDSGPELLQQAMARVRVECFLWASTLGERDCHSDETPKHKTTHKTQRTNPKQASIYFHSGFASMATFSALAYPIYGAIASTYGVLAVLLAAGFALAERRTRMLARERAYGGSGLCWDWVDG